MLLRSTVSLAVHVGLRATNHENSAREPSVGVLAFAIIFHSSSTLNLLGESGQIVH